MQSGHRSRSHEHSPHKCETTSSGKRTRSPLKSGSAVKSTGHRSKKSDAEVSVMSDLKKTNKMSLHATNAPDRFLPKNVVLQW